MKKITLLGLAITGLLASCAQQSRESSVSGTINEISSVLTVQ